MARWRKTTYTEFVGDHGPGASPIFQLGQDMSRAQRVLDFAWPDLYQAAKDFLGESSVIYNISNSVSYLSRITPHNIQRGPTTAGFEFLYCSQFSNVVGIGAPDDRDYQDAADMATYKLARVSCAYETLDYNVISDEDMVGYGLKDAYGHPDESTCARYVIRKSKPKGQYLNVPRGTMQFVGAAALAANAGINQPPGKIVPSVTIELTRVQVPARAVSSQFVCEDQDGHAINLVNSTNAANDTNYLDKYLGTVNLTPLLGARIGTLLFTAVDLRPHRNAFGRRTFDVTLMFDYSPQTDSASPPTKFGHNLVPARVQANPAVDGWVEISADGATNFGVYAAGKNIYDYAEHANLFKVPAMQS